MKNRGCQNRQKCKNQFYAVHMKYTLNIKIKDKLKVNRLKKIHHANNKMAGMAILIFDKIRFQYNEYCQK